MTKSAAAARYRAYAKSNGVSRQAGVKPWAVEEVAFEGNCDDGRAEFDAGGVKISKVVFYAGDPENESVVGSVEVDATGPVSVELPDEDGDA